MSGHALTRRSFLVGSAGVAAVAAGEAEVVVGTHAVRAL